MYIPNLTLRSVVSEFTHNNTRFGYLISPAGGGLLAALLRTQTSLLSSLMYLRICILVTLLSNLATHHPISQKG